MIYERRMSPTRPALLQPVALGLAAGLLLGAIYLGVKGALLATSDCAPGTSAEDCLLEGEIATELSRLLFLSSFGLVLVAIGALVFLRATKKGAA